MQEMDMGVNYEYQFNWFGTLVVSDKLNLMELARFGHPNTSLAQLLFQSQADDPQACCGSKNL